MAQQIGQVTVSMVYCESAISAGNCEYDKCGIPVRGLYQREVSLREAGPFYYRACCAVHAQLAHDEEQSVHRAWEES